MQLQFHEMVVLFFILGTMMSVRERDWLAVMYVSNHDEPPCSSPQGNYFCKSRHFRKVPGASLAQPSAMYVWNSSYLLQPLVWCMHEACTTGTQTVSITS